MNLRLFAAPEAVWLQDGRLLCPVGYSCLALRPFLGNWRRRNPQQKLWTDSFLPSSCFHVRRMHNAIYVLTVFKQPAESPHKSLILRIYFLLCVFWNKNVFFFDRFIARKDYFICIALFSMPRQIDRGLDWWPQYYYCGYMYMQVPIYCCSWLTWS